MVSQTVGHEPLICREINLDGSQAAYFYQKHIKNTSTCGTILIES